MQARSFRPGHWLALLLSLAAPLAIAQAAGAAGSADCSPTARLTAANRAVVEQFVHTFYVERAVRRAFETHVSAARYIQHNPGLADGREAAIVALEPMLRNPAFRIEPLRIVVEGEMAVVHLRVISPTAPRGAAVVDMFRLQDGLIVEHWDVLQVMPEKVVSQHPMF